MFKKVIIVFTMLMMCGIVYAQDVTENGTPKNRKYGFFAGYSAFKLVNPGVQAGAERYLATTKNFQVIVSGSIYYYNQEDIQSAFGADVRIGQRFTFGFGLFLDTYFGAGFQRTSYINKTFEYSGSTGTIQTENENRFAIVPKTAFGIGYDFEKLLNVPLKLYVRPVVGIVYPDRNQVFQSFYSIEVGLLYVPVWQ